MNVRCVDKEFLHVHCMSEQVGTIFPQRNSFCLWPSFLRYRQLSNIWSNKCIKLARLGFANIGDDMECVCVCLCVRAREINLHTVSLVTFFLSVRELLSLWPRGHRNYQTYIHPSRSLQNPELLPDS